MDIALYGRVLRRYWFLVLGGLILATALAILSTAKITQHGLKYRKPVIWQSQTTVLLTQQKGFPEGRALFPPAKPGKPYPFADQGRLASLTDLYSQMAQSDAVKALMRRDGAPAGFTFSAVSAPAQPGAILPVINLFGQADTPGGAMATTRIGSKAFVSYLTQQQNGADIPDASRVEVQTLAAPTPPIVLVPRKKTLPAVVFIAVLFTAIALAFVLDNARTARAARAVATVSDERIRRSA
jgi:hypothetical protein